MNKMIALSLLRLCLLPLVSFNVGAAASKAMQAGFRQGQPSTYSNVFESGVKDIQWVGAQNQAILTQTYGDRLWHSPDGGRSWSDVTGKLAEA